MILRRQFLAALAAVFPALAVTKAQALTEAPAVGRGLVPADGTWAILEHVTDGTDPSTVVAAAPHFSSEIRALSGQIITLTGYLQPVAGGFGGQQDYVLSRAPFHCPYCYPFGRGSLALVSLKGHSTVTDKPVTVVGALTLQESDPADFYFQIKDARLS